MASVLIVDDEPFIIRFVTDTLRSGGYEVMAASSGEEALRILRTDGTVDLVLSDVVMPGMPGPALLKAVKEISPATALMLMSGYPATDGPPGIAFLPKPFRPGDLVAAVQRCLAAAKEHSKND